MRSVRLVLRHVHGIPSAKISQSFTSAHAARVSRVKTPAEKIVATSMNARKDYVIRMRNATTLKGVSLVAAGTDTWVTARKNVTSKMSAKLLLTRCESDNLHSRTVHQGPHSIQTFARVRTS